MDTSCDVLDKRLRIGIFRTDLIPDRGRFGTIEKLFDKRGFALPCLRFDEEEGSRESPAGNSGCITLSRDRN